MFSRQAVARQLHRFRELRSSNQHVAGSLQSRDSTEIGIRPGLVEDELEAPMIEEE